MEKEMESTSCFSRFWDDVKQTPKRLRAQMFSGPSISDYLAANRRANQNQMKKELTAFDAMVFGIGGVVGAGVFVITGVAARTHAGPAVTISYIISAISAMLASVCYTEFAVEIPVAGGAFSYLLVTLGEFPAFITVSNLLLEYLLSSAAIARGFTSYFSTLCGKNSDSFLITVGDTEIDLVAVCIIGVLLGIICYSTKDSSIFNMAVTVGNISIVIFIIIAGLILGNPKNLTNDFTPFGYRGIFEATALVFFSFIGFDSISTLAEEVKKPSRDLPIGMIASVFVVTFLYVMMCVSLCMMVPYNLIDEYAPFPAAFNHVANWKWAKYMVAFGALMGIFTSLMVALIGQSRITLVIGRAGLIPSAFSEINDKTGTPIAATIGLGCLSALIACFTEMESLTSMVSIGTLLIFIMVSVALLFKRYHIRGTSSPYMFLLHVSLIIVFAISLSIFYHFSNSFIGPIIFLTLWFLSTLSFHIFVPELARPAEFCAPFQPWLSSFSILLNIFIMSSLKMESFIRFLVWTCFATCVYVFYGVHAHYHAGSAHHQNNINPAVMFNSIQQDSPLPREKSSELSEISLAECPKIPHSSVSNHVNSSDRERLWSSPSS